MLKPKFIKRYYPVKGPQKKLGKNGRRKRLEALLELHERPRIM
jgi:hypothetical protein